MLVKNMQITDVSPYDKNPRFNDDAVDAVAKSIQEFGWRAPIVVDSDKVTLHNMEGILNSRNQDVVIISEPGLYSLILRSRKPEAKMFKRWVTHDVLPSIRKTGAYLAPNIPLEKLQKLMESVGEQYKMLIERRDLKKLVINIVMQYFVLLKMRRVQ
jgi:hypothetical protein